MIWIADFFVVCDDLLNSDDEFEDSDRNEVDQLNFHSILDPRKIKDFLLFNNNLVILNNFQIFKNYILKLIIN